MSKLQTHANHIALLLIRVVIGISMISHGWGKVFGGVERWTGLGGAMANLGITFAPAFWGFCAAIAEFGGGILLIVGLLTRPAAAALAFTMFVAMLNHAVKGDGFGKVSHPLELLAVCLGLVLMGAGLYSLDHIVKTQWARRRATAPATDGDSAAPS